MAEKSSRISVTLPESVRKVITALAEQAGVSESTIIQTFVTRGLTIESIVQSGGDVVLKTADGREIPIATKYGHLISDYKSIQKLIK